MPLSPVPHVRGLVLAAGSGTRMGGPKALLRQGGGGATLVEHAVDVLLEGGCDGVSIVVGAAAAEVAALLTDRMAPPSAGSGLDIVTCPDWAEGMGASLRAGLTALAARPDVDAALVTLVDLLDVGPAVVERLLAATSEPSRRAQLSRAAYGGQPGHPALIGRDHWGGVVAAAAGDRGARDYYRAHAHGLVECGDLATGRDADTPADLA